MASSGARHLRRVARGVLARAPFEYECLPSRREPERQGGRHGANARPASPPSPRQANLASRSRTQLRREPSMNATQLPQAVRGGIVRGLTIVGLAGIALIHLLDTSGQFEEKPY